MKNLFATLALLVLISGCKPETKPGWQEMPAIDDFGNDTGETLLRVNGYRLSDGLNEAYITYHILEDLISGGYKPIFTISINGSPSSENVIIETPDKQKVEFECYDGIIFNIDAESDNVERFIELMNYKELRFSQGKYAFTINASGFSSN